MPRSVGQNTWLPKTGSRAGNPRGGRHEQVVCWSWPQECFPLRRRRRRVTRADITTGQTTMTAAQQAQYKADYQAAKAQWATMTPQQKSAAIASARDKKLKDLSMIELVGQRDDMTNETAARSDRAQGAARHGEGQVGQDDARAEAGDQKISVGEETRGVGQHRAGWATRRYLHPAMVEKRSGPSRARGRAQRVERRSLALGHVVASRHAAWVGLMRRLAIARCPLPSAGSASAPTIRIVRQNCRPPTALSLVRIPLPAAGTPAHRSRVPPARRSRRGLRTARVNRCMG